jgi:hypothetical protein
LKEALRWSGGGVAGVVAVVIAARAAASGFGQMKRLLIIESALIPKSESHRLGRMRLKRR